MFPPLLLLLGGCVFIIPVLISNSRMELRKIWLKGVLLISLSHFLISSVILTSIPPEHFIQGRFGHPIFLGPFLISALPLTVFLKPTSLVSLDYLCFLVYLLNSILWSIPVAGLCYLKRSRQERAAKRHHDKVQAAIAKITEDGVVEGPKGPYVPHKRWNVGTPHDTSPPKGRSYDGGPWPD